MKPNGPPPFYSAREEVKDLHVPSLELAFLDKDFLLRRETRAIRLQLEYLKPEIIQREQHIHSTVVIFGSARIEPLEIATNKLREAEEAFAADGSHHHQKMVEATQKNLARSRYYEEARRLGLIISQACQNNPPLDFVVVTGGGPGIMEAANRGAHEANAKSIGLSILLPLEQESNEYITPGLNFQFHYFAIRKMHFLMRARALVFFPGGYGTFDELFEILTLMQTRKVAQVPLLLFGKDYWTKAINFDFLVQEGAIDPEDRELFQYVETAEQAWHVIHDFYHLNRD